MKAISLQTHSQILFWWFTTDSFYLCMYVAGICVTCTGYIPVHQFFHSCLGLEGDPASFTPIMWDMQSIEHVMVLPRVLLSVGRVQKTSGGNCTGSILIRSRDHLSWLLLLTKKQRVYSFRIYSTSPPPCPWGWALVRCTPSSFALTLNFSLVVLLGSSAQPQ